ncbi:hypothetical protein K5X82_17700 [Halosquirtibacter xylanolyticus]|uniref:hypothetical protein n=1 Tax=Halosquirtibacter xylanolyticus TaxID=3374599 RepID=UPI003749C636|nr:hypothetical protein K5X82_17700 [Prolixibacteraceae bacterium]
MRFIAVIILILFYLEVGAKRLPQKRKKIDFSIEYIHSPNTYNRSIRAIGYFQSNILWGIYGENTSDKADALMGDAESKGCLYNVFGYRLTNFLSLGPMVGVGRSLYNDQTFQYGGFMGIRVSKILLSCQYTSTSSFGVGLGLYFK